MLGSFDVWVKDPGAARRSFDLPPLRGLYAGLVAPFGRLFGNDNLSLGVLLYVPFDYVMQTYVPPRADSRYLPVFHDAYRRAAFSLAAAYRVLPELSVGIGVDLFMDLAGGSVITFGERTTEWEEHYGVDIDVTREIELDPALLAGVLANPWPWLSVGVSYRMEERADTALVPNSFLIGGFDVDLAIHYANFFRPHQVSVGACLRAPE